RRARRADPAPPRRQGLANPAAAQANDAAHHPQHYRGGATRRPHRGDDVSAREGGTGGGGQTAASPQLRKRVERGIWGLRGADLGGSSGGGKPRGGWQGERGGGRKGEAMAAPGRRAQK